MKNKRTFTTATAILLCFSAFGAPAQAQLDHSQVAMLEKYMAQLINRDRVKHGKAPIKVNTKLCALARSYAEEMARTGKFSHVDKKGLDPQARARQAGIECGIYENLGWQKNNDTPFQMLEAVERSMMSEPENQKNHRYNILHENHYCMGVGVAMKKNHLYAVHEFADEEPAGSESVFPNQLALPGQMGGNFPNQVGGSPPNETRGNFQPGVPPGFAGRRLVPPPQNRPVLGPSGDPTVRDADDGIPQESDGTKQPNNIDGKPGDEVPFAPQRGANGGFGQTGSGGFDGNAGGGVGTNGNQANTQSSFGGVTGSEAEIIQLPEDDSEESFEKRRREFLQKDRMRDMRDDEVHNDLED